MEALAEEQRCEQHDPRWPGSRRGHAYQRAQNTEHAGSVQHHQGARDRGRLGEDGGVRRRVAVHHEHRPAPCGKKRVAMRTRPKHVQNDEGASRCDG